MKKRLIKSATYQEEVDIITKACIVVDDLRDQLRKAKIARNKNEISEQEYVGRNKFIKSLMQNTKEDIHRQIWLLKVAVTRCDPQKDVELEARFQADMEKRLYKKFMTEATPVLEKALSLEEI